MRVEINDLETRRFGFSFGRLDAVAARHGLGESLAAADADGIEVVSTRVDTTDLGLVRAVEDHGFRIMDTLVYHRRTLPLAERGDAAGQVSDLTEADARRGATLARRAFRRYLGHYHADPRLSDDAADDAYADWTARLLTDPPPGQIALGTRNGDGLTGFLIGQPRADGTSEIVLNAVDPDAQRGGIYTALLRTYLQRAGARGDREVVISTQLQNYPVQRAWSRAGFVLYRSFHTLHRWARV